jgi:hypothetical protein
VHRQIRPDEGASHTIAAQVMRFLTCYVTHVHGIKQPCADPLLKRTPRHCEHKHKLRNGFRTASRSKSCNRNRLTKGPFRPNQRVSAWSVSSHFKTWMVVRSCTHAVVTAGSPFRSEAIARAGIMQHRTKIFRTIRQRPLHCARSQPAMRDDEYRYTKPKQAS